MAVPAAPGVRVDLLDDVFYRRLDAALADPRLRGLVRCASAVRTFEQQVALWNGYLQGLPGFNTAANPYATSVMPGYTYDLRYRQGSWHMVQHDGRGYAVDLNHSELPGDVQAILADVLREYRLVLTVFRPQFEPWHYQMDWGDWTWVPADSVPAPEPAPTPPPPAMTDQAWLVTLRRNC